MLRNNIEQLIKAKRSETGPQDVLSLTCYSHRVEHGRCPPPSFSRWLADARSFSQLSSIQNKRPLNAGSEKLVTLSFVRDRFRERRECLSEAHVSMSNLSRSSFAKSI